MIKVVKLITMLMVLFTVCSCKNEAAGKQGISNKESEEIIDEMYDETPDPPKAPAVKQGEVIFGTDAFEVVEEETDNVSIMSQFINGDNGPEMTSAKYREKVFLLINKKTRDKITIHKSLFKDYSNKGDFPQMLLQSVAFDIDAKSGNIPFLVSLCKPDTDICDDYSITVKTAE